MLDWLAVSHKPPIESLVHYIGCTSHYSIRNIVHLYTECVAIRYAALNRPLNS